MRKRIKRSMALFLAAALCTSCIPELSLRAAETEAGTEFEETAASEEMRQEPETQVKGEISSIRKQKTCRRRVSQRKYLQPLC